MTFDVARSTARLLLAPIAGAALLSYKSQLYLVASMATASRLLPYLPMILIETKGPGNPLKRTNGVAEVMFADETKAIVRLAANEAVDMVEFKAEDSAGPYGDWIYGAYQDKWIGTEAEIEIVDGAQVAFEMYAPERDGASAKTVVISWDGGEITVPLPRGRLVSHPPIQLDGGRRRIRLSVDTHEAHSSTSDQRFLGVLVNSVILDQNKISPWIHYGVFPLGATRVQKAA